MLEDRALLEESAGEVAVEPDCGTEAMLYEDELELVRRIDWRFLLPDPNLGTVAYVGPEDETLTSALKRFCDSLIMLDGSTPSGSGQEDQRYDVLTSRADWNQTARACSRLRKGGYLYWEIERASPLGIFGSKTTPASLKTGRVYFNRYIELLESSGFRDVSVHWHRPDFDNCLDIVPLNTKGALEHFFSRDSADIKGRVKKIGGLFLNKTGLVHRWAPCISLTASKKKEQRP
ncbi:hypothetical protein MJD09_07225 [bacterium]|nr:hypothetical protein [bacterium]